MSAYDDEISGYDREPIDRGAAPALNASERAEVERFGIHRNQALPLGIHREAWLERNALVDVDAPPRAHARRWDDSRGIQYGFGIVLGGILALALIVAAIVAGVAGAAH